MKKIMTILTVSALFLSACGSATPVTTTSSEVNIFGLTFTLPNQWLLQKVDIEKNREVAQITVPDPKYNVIVPVSVSKSEKVIGASDTMVKETTSGAKIYQCAGAPMIACHYIDYEGGVYQVTFEMPSSDEPTPPGMDGPWFPSTTITEKDTLEFVATVK